MKRKFIAIVSLALAMALLFCSCGMLDDAAKLTEYDFGSDKVPSVNAVIQAERKVTGADVGTTNGVPYRQYTYESPSMVDDLANYTTYLRNNGWIATKDYNFNEGSGLAELATESADSGKVLIMSIAFEQGKYAIRVSKTVGELTRN